MPGPHGNVSTQAKKIKYATISLSFGKRGGLLVLAENTDQLTFWQTGRDEVIVLRNGYLESTSGFLPQLEMSKRSITLPPFEPGQTVSFEVHKLWRSKTGERHAGSAQARLSCPVSPSLVELPLVSRKLFECHEVLDWASQDSTQSIYWLDRDGRVWKADVVAWPGAPHVRWRVARPWWS